MRTMFRGLTQSVITFNTLDVILHGQETIGIKIETEAQKREIAELLGANLIAIMDAPQIQSVNVEKTAEVNDPKPIKKGRGRPKGSKNPKNLKNKPREVKKSENIENNQLEGTVIVGTASGPVSGKMKKNVVSDLPESEQTRASLEAMKKLEDEEVEEARKEATRPPVDESRLDVSERMGNKATIATGKDHKELEMKNSYVPESEVIKEADPFIKEETDDKIDDVFIDKDKEVDKDDGILDDILEH